jgi:hypothetical protein
MGTLASGTTMSVFVAAETTFANAFNYAVANTSVANGPDSSDGINRFSMSLRNNTTNTHTVRAADVVQGSAGTTADNTAYVSALVYGGFGVTSYLTLNGAVQTFSPTVTLPNSSASTTSVFSIGDSRSTPDVVRACKRVAEVIMYDRALSIAERQMVENYLMSKYP